MRLVRIRPHADTLHLSHGRTVLATGRDGCIAPHSPHGLIVYETRLVRTLRYFINGVAPRPNVLSNVGQHSFLGYYLALAPGARVERDTGSGHVPPESQHPLELRVSRFAGDGLHEDLDLTNFARQSTRFTFEIEIETDCSDIGDLDRPVTIDRRVEIGFSRAPFFDGNRSRFELELEPRATWHLCIDFAPEIDGHRMRPAHRCRSFHAPDSFETRFDMPALDVLATLDQARSDLASMRLYDLDGEDPTVRRGPPARPRAGEADQRSATHRGWTMAAGVPLYVALFGRDTLTASWQAAMLGPEMMRGTVDVLARHQGTKEDDWRDEQPGRMLHEAHTGPLSALNIDNRGRSYGSITTSGLYAFTLAELWHWTGDESAVRPYVGNALRALQWLDRERLHDGLYTYQTRSSDGVKHQAWKDSPDAIVYEDGSPVEPPIATCEEQGFVYIAKLHFAETLWSLGERDEARRLLDEALRLRDRFNDAFWMEDEGYYALALDANGRQVRSIASNAGHCIATAIADDAHVERVVNRMFAPDLFSGWGIRTLSSDHPAYNPYSYHLGSIWPVEHGTFALGFMRYGLHDRVQQLARAQFEAASLFEANRLPELFSGHACDDDHPFPALYPNANPVQAWSASTVFSLVEAMLGLYPYAPLNVLLVDPHLPAWLPELTIRDLRVGDAKVTLRFHGTHWQVVEKVGNLHVVQQPMPWSLRATRKERVWDLIKSLKV